MSASNSQRAARWLLHAARRIILPNAARRTFFLMGAPVLLFALLAHCATVRATLFVDPMFDVNVTYNQVYGESAGGDGVYLERLLDVYQPTGPGLPAELPAIVLMHGGYFVSGGKSNMSGYANMFAERGYVAVTINYRLLHELPDPPGAPINTDPERYPDWLEGALVQWGVTDVQYFAEIAAAVADQAMAVNWLADHAGTYNIDPQRIAAGGYSAGALSSLALGVGGVDGVQANVGAVFSRAGGLFGLESFVDPSDPGVYILHGTLDGVIPYTEVGFLVDALTDAGVPYKLDIVEGAGHGVPLTDPDPLFEFMAEQLDLLQNIPEPSTILIWLILGAIGLIAVRRRRK